MATQKPKDDVQKEEVILAAENEQLRKELEELKALVQAALAVKKEEPVEDKKVSKFTDIEEELDISSNRMVKIVSMVVGSLHLRGNNNVIITLPEFGASRKIQFEELRAIYNNHPDLTTNGAFFIVDPLAVKALYLEEEYEKLLNHEMMENIINLPASEIHRTLNMLPKLQRDTVLQRVVRGISAQEEKYSDLNKIKIFSDIAGVDLVSISREI